MTTIKNYSLCEKYLSDSCNFQGMSPRRSRFVISLLSVAIAATVGYLIRSIRKRSDSVTTKADVGARIVSEVPHDVTVIDVSSKRLRTLPGVLRAIDKAVRNDASERWAHVTLESERAWELADALRESLPYYETSGPEYNGVYVKCNDRIIVLDAIGWAKTERYLS